MNALTATPKGAATRETILDRAYEIARFAGIEGLSLGPLAQAVGMSKSGVFAHFGSREELQLAVLQSAATRFGEYVLIAALSQPRGLPRLRAIMRNWFEWGRLEAGGCVLVGSVSEYDDRPGPLRDQVLHNEQRWRSELQRAAQLAIDCGHLRDGDTDQYAFELYAMPLAMLHEAGLFGYERARRHGDAALERWIAAHSPTA
ncbi:MULTISPECIES: TetR/AcrR family transcriptional regulator [unclassified Lysobacter]|uniref:TetR/AcrR family transcriptional regulator n=1 Tax=unclassified Lysobacter TaxID=2635362 RepID=UPI001F5846A5|nr:MULTISPECIES: TetR/AcrR family transcriptional regulator [unclassified Lysobacter]